MAEAIKQRDERGCFLPGNHFATGGVRPGSGRPPTARREMIDRVLSGLDWDAVIEVAKQKALDGDFRFVEWIADQRFGKQSVSVEVSPGDPQRGVSLSDLDAQIAEAESRRQLVIEQGEALAELAEGMASRLPAIEAGGVPSGPAVVELLSPE